MTTDYKGPPVIPAPTVLVLRTCASNLSSQRGFVWPGVGGEAVAPDWHPYPECGNGLHGWLHGQGDYSASSYLDASAKWLVVEVPAHTIVQLGGKVKFPRGVVRFVGDKKSATDYLLANDPVARDVAVIGAHIQVGDEQVAKVGALGVASSGTRGTSTSGTRGTSTSGYSGTSTSGYSGTSTSGDGGTSTSGDKGEIRIRYYDSRADRYRTKIGYVGEDGIKPNTPYKLDSNLKFVEVTKP